MTSAQTVALRSIAIKHFTRVLEDALPLVGKQGIEVKDGLLPLWRRALHETLVEARACSCVTAEGSCFMNWSEEEQLARFAQHPWGFDRFQTVFHQGVAIAALARAAPTDTQ